MEVIRELTENKGIAVALGYFDGMHLGHKRVIQILITRARQMNLKTAVITFDTNPASYFSSEPVLNLMTFKDKERIMSSLGIDYLYELDFAKFKDMTAQEYLDNVIKKYFDPKLIVIGYNHTFGKDISGNSIFLSEQAKKLQYELITVPEYKYNDKEKISSSIIRERIKHGHLNAIRALLGRNYMISNSVVQGNKVARTLGYPTANIIWPDGMTKLPYGVYYGFCQVNAKLIPSLISWGTRPTLTAGDEEVLEAHLYKFQENLYGRIIKILFVKKFREQICFSNMKELKEQIRNDYSEFMKWANANKIS